jgi:hypothetical protein
MVFGGKTRRVKTAMNAKKRFAVGARIRVMNPGLTGVVIQADDEPTVIGEYWHEVRTEFGESKEPGSNLELVPAPMTNSAPRAPKLADTIYFHGPNARINLDSTDNSTNIASMSHDSPFIQIKETAHSIADETERQDVLTRLDELEKARGSAGFMQAYQNFVASAANHMTLLAPFMPLLGQLVSQHFQ